MRFVLTKWKSTFFLNLILIFKHHIDKQIYLYCRFFVKVTYVVAILKFYTVDDSWENSVVTEWNKIDKISWYLSPESEKSTILVFWSHCKNEHLCFKCLEFFMWQLHNFILKFWSYWMEKFSSYVIADNCIRFSWKFGCSDFSLLLSNFLLFYIFILFYYKNLLWLEAKKEWFEMSLDLYPLCPSWKKNIFSHFYWTLIVAEGIKKIWRWIAHDLLQSMCLTYLHKYQWNTM